MSEIDSQHILPLGAKSSAPPPGEPTSPPAASRIRSTKSGALRAVPKAQAASSETESAINLGASSSERAPLPKPLTAPKKHPLARPKQRARPEADAFLPLSAKAGSASRPSLPQPKKVIKISATRDRKMLGSMKERRKKALEEKVVVLEDGYEQLDVAAAEKFKESDMLFTITLRKTPELSRLGVTATSEDQIVLLVNEVKDGMIKDWNSKNPMRAVENGDKIVACNGVQGRSVDLVGELASANVLELTICKKDYEVQISDYAQRPSWFDAHGKAHLPLPKASAGPGGANMSAEWRQRLEKSRIASAKPELPAPLEAEAQNAHSGVEHAPSVEESATSNNVQNTEQEHVEETAASEQPSASEDKAVKDEWWQEQSSRSDISSSHAQRDEHDASRNRAQSDHVGSTSQPVQQATASENAADDAWWQHQTQSSSSGSDAKPKGDVQHERSAYPSNPSWFAQRPNDAGQTVTSGQADYRSEHEGVQKSEQQKTFDAREGGQSQHESHGRQGGWNSSWSDWRWDANKEAWNQQSQSRRPENASWQASNDQGYSGQAYPQKRNDWSWDAEYAQGRHAGKDKENQGWWTQQAAQSAATNVGASDVSKQVAWNSPGSGDRDFKHDKSAFVEQTASSAFASTLISGVAGMPVFSKAQSVARVLSQGDTGYGMSDWKSTSGNPEIALGVMGLHPSQHPLSTMHTTAKASGYTTAKAPSPNLLNSSSAVGTPVYGVGVHPTAQPNLGFPSSFDLSQLFSGTGGAVSSTASPNHFSALSLGLANPTAGTIGQTVGDQQVAATKEFPKAPWRASKEVPMAASQIVGEQQVAASKERKRAVAQDVDKATANKGKRAKQDSAESGRPQKRSKRAPAVDLDSKTEDAGKPDVNYSVGEDVQYWSVTHRKWMETRIEVVHMDQKGSVLSCEVVGKPGVKVDVSRLRKRKLKTSKAKEKQVVSSAQSQTSGKPQNDQSHASAKPQNDQSHASGKPQSDQSHISAKPRSDQSHVAGKPHSDPQIIVGSKKNDAPTPLEGIQVGSRVGYWSGTHNKWVKTVVTAISFDADGRPFYCDVKGKKDADLDKLKLLGLKDKKAGATETQDIPQPQGGWLFPPETTAKAPQPDLAEEMMARCRAFAEEKERQRLAGLQSKAAEKATRTSALRNAIETQEEQENTAPIENASSANAKFKVGQRVMYFSSSFQKYIKAEVLQIREKSGAAIYDLNCKPAVPEAILKPAPPLVKGKAGSRKKTLGAQAKAAQAQSGVIPNKAAQQGDSQTKGEGDVVHVRDKVVIDDGTADDDEVSKQELRRRKWQSWQSQQQKKQKVRPAVPGWKLFAQAAATATNMVKLEPQTVVV